MISYRQHREEFTKFLKSKKLNRHYIHNSLSSLDRWLADAVIETPLDVHNLFGGLTSGQANNFNKGLRAFLNYLELTGLEKAYLDSLRKAIPSQQFGIDNEVPTKDTILHSLEVSKGLTPKYQTAFNLLLDSGLRITEAGKLISEFDPKKAVKVGSFYRYKLDWTRGCKSAYQAYFSAETFRLLCENAGNHLDEGVISKHFRRHGLLAPKYIRKFTFDTMLSEEVGIPESVCDFIEGRTPKRIGARHYSQLVKQADGWYGRYAELLATLRSGVAAPKLAVSSLAGHTELEIINSFLISQNACLRVDSLNSSSKTLTRLNCEQ